MNKQIERIITKLELARKADSNFDVFGADSHEYYIGIPLAEEAVCKFETSMSIRLPLAYKQFITKVGSGDKSGNVAGPYYGIYPLGKNIGDLGFDNTGKYLSYPCLLSVDMTDEKWESLSSATVTIEDDDAYNEVVGTLYGGLLPIGTQGCGITTSLVLNGLYEGRIVYTNEDQKPQFAFESNFLDWYERWLNEIISGDLLDEQAGWFGYSRGGTAEELWTGFKQELVEQEKVAYLKALIGKRNLSESLLEEMRLSVSESTRKVSLELARTIAKFNYSKAKTCLEKLSVADLLHVLQTVHWYGKEDSKAWVELIEERFSQINDPETFRFATYVLANSGVDYGELMRGVLTSEEEEIRGQVIYMVGKLPNKMDYVDLFIKGLQDADERVVLYTLQALSGGVDVSLLPYLKDVAIKYEVSEGDYITSNLNYLLEEYGLSRQELLDDGRK